jgi:signal transduction histidine kinase/CheY-like chemotaxis protein
MSANKHSLFTWKERNFSQSIVVKSVVLFILLIVIVLFVSSYFINKKATSTIQLYSQDRLIHASNIVERSFYSMLKEVENDISFVSKSIALERFENNEDVINSEDLNNLFPTLLGEKPNYFQIRLLDVKNNGKELLKFEKQPNTIIKTLNEKLQFKGDKAYYKKALRVEQRFYFSEINLNEDYGKISIPFKPTLRAISKLYDRNGVLKFLIIVNVNLSSFYEDISQINKQEIKNIIVDSLGDYKYHSVFENCFGKQKGTNSNFESSYNVNLNTFFYSENNTLLSFDEQPHVYHLKKITYSEGLNTLYLITIASQKDILINVNSINKYSLYVVFIICIILFTLICLYAYFFAIKIRGITSAIESYNTQDFSDSYLINIKERKDELGLLARTYLKMKNDIDTNIVKLKNSLKKEKEAVKDKNEFLQNMGHEIRTPLNAILGLVKLLTRNKPSENQIPIINALERSANNLNGLMHDILDEQLFIQGKIILTPSETDIDKQLKTIVSNYVFDAIKKGLKINLKTSEELKTKKFSFDTLRFEQVVTNLLVNAIKYTSKGQIDIEAKVNKEQLFVEVKDTGSGISSENLKKIKTRFYRVDNPSTSKEEGFGLGLSIVKQIIDLFRGSLEVHSIPEKGSVFSFSFPIEEVEIKNDLGSKNDFPYPSHIKGCNVLHIEDDSSSLVMIKNALESIGIKVKQVSSLKEIEQVIQNTYFDLILTDLMLESENISPYVNCTLSKYRNPVIAFSAFDYSEISNLEVPFLQKPLELDKLTDCIVALMCQKIYDTPKLENIYKLYDDDTNKVNNYLNILLEEFEQYHLRIQAVIKSKEEKEWVAIKHKIITHINSLELNQIKTLLEENIKEIPPKKAQFLIDNIRYVLCNLRNIIRINSTN